MIVGEQKKAYNRAYYEARKERLAAEALARYHAGGKDRVDRVALAAYYKSWRAAKPEKAKRTREQEKRSQLRFKERYMNDAAFRRRLLDSQSVYGQLHPIMRRKVNLKKKYGITIEEFDTMFVAQGGKCAICGDDKPTGKDRRSFLHVDHCHVTKKFRGLLCQKCNRAIGLFNDDVDRIRRAAGYLERNKN